MIRINLSKPEKKTPEEHSAVVPPEEKEAKKLPSQAVIFILLLVVIGTLFFLQSRSIRKEKNLLTNAQEEKSQLQYVLVKLEKLEEQKRLFQRKINLIRQLKSFQEVAVRIMDELSRTLPEWVWLTETTYRGQNVEIEGKALSNNLIADYIFNLENSPYFNNVNLLSSSQRKVRNNQFLEFSLTAQYVLPEGVQLPANPSTKERKR
ncbi:MAG: PilN domain-containing protein [Candidatus Aminicenantes bacterium]